VADILDIPFPGWQWWHRPSTEKNFDFGSQNGDFRYILGTVFTVQLIGLNAKASSRR